MNEEPLVSIIVNCYNSEKYLKETVDSIFAQSYTHYEIIFWDNQSTDSTASIIKSYDDPRVKYYYAEKHTTLGEARNLAMQKVKGELLTFLDSDDVWLPEFLKRAVDALRSTDDYAFYYSNYYNWIDGKELIPNNPETQDGVRGFGDLLSAYHIGMSAAVIKLTYLLPNRLFFDNKYQLIEDYDFFLKIVRWGKAYYDSVPLMKYRMHEASLSNQSKKNWGVELDMLYEDLLANVLGEDERRKYSKQLDWLKVRVINAYAEEDIVNGNRIHLLKLIVRNIHLNIKLAFPLLYLLMSRKCYFKLKACLLKTSYHV